MQRSLSPSEAAPWTRSNEPSPLRRLRKPVPHYTSQRAPYSYVTEEAPLPDVRRSGMDGMVDEAPLPNVSRTTARYDPAVPAPLGLVSPMRSSRQQQATSDAYAAPAPTTLPPLSARSPDTMPAPAAVPPYLLDAILATVARATEARFLQEREATQVALAQTSTRVEAIAAAVVATRSSVQAALRDAVDDMRSLVRQEMKTLETRVAACERSPAQRGPDSTDDAPAAIVSVQRALEQRMDALQASVSSRLAELRVDVDGAAASRIAGEDATSTRIASLSRQLADVSNTAAAALARASDASSAAAHALDAAPAPAPHHASLADGIVLEDGTFEDGHAGPRLITRVAFDAFAAGMRADMDALRASTRDGLRVADENLNGSIQLVQKDVSDALSRLDTVTANRLDVVTSTLSDGIADVAEKLRDTTRMAQELYDYTHEAVPSLQASLGRHVATSQADMEAAVRAGEKREAALGDALLRGLTQEAAARDDAIADALAQAHADAQSVVSSAVREVHATLERVKLDAQSLYDRSRTSAASSDGALAALQQSLHSAIDDSSRAAREGMDRVRADMLQHAQEATSAAQRAQSSADAAVLGIERLQAAHEGQADVLRNLDATVTELSAGVSTYAATLEQHDATLSQIVEGELRVFLTSQAERLAKVELDMAAAIRLTSDVQSLRLDIASVREDVTSAGREHAAEAVHASVEALGSNRERVLSDSETDEGAEGHLAVLRNIDRSISEITSSLRSHASSIDALRTQSGTVIPKLAELRTDCDELRASVQVLTKTTATRSTERELKLHQALAAHEAPAEVDKLSSRLRDLERQVGEHATHLANVQQSRSDAIASATGIDVAADGPGDAAFRTRVDRVLAQHTEALADVAVQADLHVLHDTVHAALRALQGQVEAALRSESDARYDAVTQLQQRVMHEEKTRNAELDDLAHEIRDHLAKAVDISTQRSVVALQRQLQPLAVAHEELQIRVEVERCVDYLLDTISDAFAPQVALAVAEHAVSAALGTSRSSAGMRSSRTSIAKFSSTDDVLGAATARAGPPMHALPLSGVVAPSSRSDAEFTGTLSGGR